MATPIYLPNAARALPRPRVYAPQSNTGTAAMAGGLSALSQVAEIWRDKKNFEQQAEQMAQTLEREGMTEQASLYRNAAQNAATNFFSDPATNRKAQQGLLSDALKLLQQKQENDLRREIENARIDAQVSEETRRNAEYDRRVKENLERNRRSYNFGAGVYNEGLPAEAPPSDRMPVIPEGSDINPELLPAIPKPMTEEDRARLEIAKEQAATAKMNAEERKAFNERADKASDAMKSEFIDRKNAGENIELEFFSNGRAKRIIRLDKDGKVTHVKGWREVLNTQTGEVEKLEWSTESTTTPQSSSDVGTAPGSLYVKPPAGPDASLFPNPVEDAFK